MFLEYSTQFQKKRWSGQIPFLGLQQSFKFPIHQHMELLGSCHNLLLPFNNQPIPHSPVIPRLTRHSQSQTIFATKALCPFPLPLKYVSLYHHTLAYSSKPQVIWTTHNHQHDQFILYHSHAQYTTKSTPYSKNHNLIPESFIENKKTRIYLNLICLEILLKNRLQSRNCRLQKKQSNVVTIKLQHQNLLSLPQD